MKHYSQHKGEILAVAEFIRSKGYAKTHEVNAWAQETKRCTNRADRNARKLGELGFIRRLTDEEEDRMYGDIGERVWKWVSDYSNTDIVIVEPNGQLALALSK